MKTIDFTERNPCAKTARRVCVKTPQTPRVALKCPRGWVDGARASETLVPDLDAIRLDRLIRRRRLEIAANKILVPITLSLSLAAVLVAIVTIVTVLLSTGVFS